MRILAVLSTVVSIYAVNTLAIPPEEETERKSNPIVQPAPEEKLELLDRQLASYGCNHSALDEDISRADLLAQLDLSDWPSAPQEYLLKYIGNRSLTELCLRNASICSVFSNKNTLVRLDLSGHQSLTLVGTEPMGWEDTIYESISHLEPGYFSFPNLQILCLAGSTRLTGIYVIAPQLKTFDASGCTSLHAVDLHGPDGQRTKMPYLDSLTIAGSTYVESLYATAPNLKLLDATGCNNIESITIRERRVLLARDLKTFRGDNLIRKLRYNGLL